MTPEERDRFYKYAERLKLQKIGLDQREEKLDQRKQKLKALNLEYIIYCSLPDSEKNANYDIWVKQFREKIRLEKSLVENPILAKIHEELSTIRKELNDKKELEKNVSLLKEKVIKLEKMTGHLLKSNTKQSFDSLDKRMKDMKDDLKHEIEKGLTETKLNLLEAEWDWYKSDIEHLHRKNIEKASELTDD